jgi:hypothetical protein
MKPKYSLGQIVVADLSVDKVVGYIIEIQTFSDGKTFNGWYKIYDLYSGMTNPQFTAKEDWLETYEEFSDRRHSKI